MYIVIGKDGKSSTFNTLQELLDHESPKVSETQQAKDLLFHAVNLCVQIGAKSGKIPALGKMVQEAAVAADGPLSKATGKRRDKPGRRARFFMSRATDKTNKQLLEIVSAVTLPSGVFSNLENMALNCSDTDFQILDTILSNEQIVAYKVYGNDPVIRRQFGTMCGRLAKQCRLFKIHDVAYISSTFKLDNVDQALLGDNVPMRVRDLGVVPVFTTHPDVRLHWKRNRETAIALRKERAKERVSESV